MAFMLDTTTRIATTRQVRRVERGWFISFILIESRKLRGTKPQQIACAAGQCQAKLIAFDGESFRLSRLS